MNAQIQVIRTEYAADWTLSKFHIKGVQMGVGVEDERRDVKVKGETCIPAGIYEIDLRVSPKFSKSYYMDKDGFISPNKDARFNKEHELIWVKNIPNFEAVLWHWGNTDDDTEGCYIVGSSFATFGVQKGVSGSRVKYVEVYPMIRKIILENRTKGLKTYVEYK
jgi:hypothetical protein